MLKVGVINWGECEKCIHWEEENGCRIIDNITLDPNLVDDTVYCIDGEISEQDQIVDYEVTWE